jgi:DNA-binding response OmpR family regulator
MVQDPRVQELEEEIELLRQQVEELTGSSRELGALLAIRHGMTERLATMLYILVKRAPAVISKSAFHSVIFGHDAEGGPEPKIFSVYISRLRGILRQVGCPGKIDTVWSAGHRANPELVKWVENLYEEAGITKERLK